MVSVYVEVYCEIRRKQRVVPKDNPFLFPKNFHILDRASLVLFHLLLALPAKAEALNHQKLVIQILRDESILLRQIGDQINQTWYFRRTPIAYHS